MSGAMRKMGVYLGLLEDSGRYDEEYDEYEAEAPEQERRPAPVSQLAEPFAMALPTVVQHLRVLEEARIVASEKVGRVRTYQLVPDALVPANAWIVAQRRPQESRLDRLGDYLTRPSPDQKD